MNQRLEALISAKAKKLAKPFIKIFYTSKAQMCNNLLGVFPIMIGFVTLGPTSLEDNTKKVAKDDKTNHGWENTL